MGSPKYSSDCYLFVVANGKESSLYPVMTEVPQGGVWSPLLFNLYVRHLPSQLGSCLLVSYADDSTLLKVRNSYQGLKVECCC